MQSLNHRFDDEKECSPEPTSVTERERRALGRAGTVYLQLTPESAFYPVQSMQGQHPDNLFLEGTLCRRYSRSHSVLVTKLVAR
jgi:hypothetical protein